jgi:hypothetical protein
LHASQLLQFYIAPCGGLEVKWPIVIADECPLTIDANLDGEGALHFDRAVAGQDSMNELGAKFEFHGALDVD